MTAQDVIIKRTRPTWKARTSERGLVGMSVGIFQGRELVAQVPLPRYTSPRPAGGNMGDPANLEAVARARCIAALPEVVAALLDIIGDATRQGRVRVTQPSIDRGRAALAMLDLGGLPEPRR